MPEESPIISRTSASGSRSTDPCVTLDGRDGEQIQVNLGRLSDSQLLDELRKDPQMLNAAGLEIEQQIEN